MRRMSLLLAHSLAPLSLVGLTIATACTPAQAPGPSLAEIKAEVRARSVAIVAAEMSGDYETATTFFAPDAIIQMGNMPQIVGRQPLLHLYNQVLGTTLEFEGTTTEIVPSASGDMAYEYGVNRFVFDTPDGPMEDMGKYLVVWVKTEGDWYVAAIAATSDSPPPLE